MRSVNSALSGNTKLMSAVMGRFVRNGSDASSNPAADWLNNKDDMYVVAGKNYPVKIVIGKILDISIRAVSYTHLTLPTKA